MNAGEQPLDQLIEEYNHRDAETTPEHVEAQEVLDGYLEARGITDYHILDTDHPYQAILGRNGPCSGEIGFNTHYTYELDGELAAGTAGVLLEAEDMGTAIEKTVKPEKVIEAAGIETEKDTRVRMPSGTEINPSSIHCAVFYDEPVPTEDMVDWSRLEGGLMHKRTIEDALGANSLGTAIVMTGYGPSGDHVSGTRIDYWTKFFDGVEDEGVDYTSLDWKDPGKL